MSFVKFQKSAKARRGVQILLGGIVVVFVLLAAAVDVRIPCFETPPELPEPVIRGGR